MVNCESGEPTELEQKIIGQIEYYFGDINLRRDKFLKEQTGKDEGWVPLSVLLTFNRLKALSEDSNVIAEALRKSDNDIIEVSEDGTKVRRSSANPLSDLSEEQLKEQNQRTVHFKGFPLDAKLEDVRGYALQYGPVLSIEMRYTKEKKFKGCCMAIYESLDSAKKALAGDEKPDNAAEKFLREDKVQYIERKRKFNRSKKDKGKDKKKEETDATVKKEEGKDADVKTEAKKEEKNGSNAKAKEVEETNPEPEEPEEVVARTVHFKGFDTRTSEEDIRKFTDQYGKVEKLVMLTHQGKADAFKGAVFVTYETNDEAEKAVKGEEQPENCKRRFIRETKAAWKEFDSGPHTNKRPGQNGGGPPNRKRKGGTFGRNRKGYQGKKHRGGGDE